MPDSTEISLSFFTDVGYEEQPIPEVGTIESRPDCLGNCQQRRQTRAVIGNARAPHIPVPIDRDIFLCARGEHRIYMCRHRYQSTLWICFERSQYVSSAIDAHVPADRPELRGYPLGA